MAAYSTRMRPDFTFGRVDTPDVANVLLDFADRQAKQEALGIDRVMQQAKLEEDKKRYETELGFKQRAEDRLLKEQAASDQYYKSLLGGPQAVGGALNTQSFINEANKYSLTPEEIAFSNANKITTAEQARQLGNENLAKKFEGQTGLSNLSDRLYSEGALQESRVQMLERALGNVANQGLPVPKELATQIDQARLAEQTAQEAKLKANTEELANLNKERKADLKWLIGNVNSGNGTATVLDENGNPVTVSTGKTLQKEITASNKSASTGIEDLQTSINKLGLSKEKKLEAIAIANELVSALEDEGVPTAEASGIVAKEMGTKENNSYLSYIGFSNMGPNANKEAIASYGKMLVDRYKKLNNVPATATSLDNNSKYKAAEAFVQGSGAATDAQIAKLTAERKALLMSPEERMRSRIDSAVAGLNPSEATGTTYKNPILGETKMPPSLVEAEGVRLKPYKDNNTVSVGVGYAFNKDRREIESDFKAAGIPISKIDGLMKMDGTQLTLKEVAALADVSYDRHGVQKLEKIGIDLKSMNPMLAEIGVVQAFRGDIVKGGSGYQGKLYDYLKNNDLDGMTKYVKSSGEVPKEVRQRLNTVVNRYGPKTEEQYKYDTKSTTDKPGAKELFEKVGTVNTDVGNNKFNMSENYENTRLGSILSKADNAFQTPGEKSVNSRNAIKDSIEVYNSLTPKDKLKEYYRLKAEVDKEGFMGIKTEKSTSSKLLDIIGKDIKDIESQFINSSNKTVVEPPRRENFKTQTEFDIAYNRFKNYYGEPGQKGVNIYSSDETEALEKIKRQTMLDMQNDTLSDTLILLNLAGGVAKPGISLVQSAYKKISSNMPGAVTKAEKEAVDKMIKEASELKAKKIAKEEDRIAIEAARKRHLDYLQSMRRSMVN